MNYLQWNNAIIKHFFNPDNEEKEVMLYFSEAIIEEVGLNNFPAPEGGYSEDFYKALRIGVIGISNDNYIERLHALDKKYKEGCTIIGGIDFNYPPTFTYLLTFLIPFTSGKVNVDYSSSMFHNYVKDFLENRHLTDNYNKQIKNKLNEIDYLWDDINNWLVNIECETIGYLIKDFNPKGNRKWISRYEYHILFRKEQEERLSMVFDENNVLPGEAISEIKMRKLLVDNYKYLRLSIHTRDKINSSSDYIGRKIVIRALAFHKNWYGQNYSIINGERGFARNKLALCLDFNFVNQIINLKYFRIFSKKGIPENLMLEKVNGGIVAEEIYQINSFYSNPIEHCFVDLNTSIQLIDKGTRSKYTWKTNNFFIFKKESQFDWVEIPRVVFGVGKTLVICRREFYEKELRIWFENITNSKKLYHDNTRTHLPDTWIAFYIESMASCPHPSILELTTEPDSYPKIEFEKSFYYEGMLFKDKLPLVWIENSEFISKIHARYEDETEIPLVQQTLVENGVPQLLNKFYFTEEHKSRDKLNRKFKLVCDDFSVHKFLQIVDFNKKSNSEIETLLPKRDLIGQLTQMEQNYFKGIEHFFTEDKIKNLIPYQNQLNDIFINTKVNEGHGKNSNYNSQQLGNLLLHYISTKGLLSKADFNNVVFSLLENRVTPNLNIKEEAIKLSYILQDLGYVDYLSSKGTFTVNKPHLVVIPCEKGTKFNLVGARDNNLINSIINFCNQNNYVTIEITNNEKYDLLPQIINFHLRKCDQSLILQLISKFEIVFKKGNLFTQFALTAGFPDIDKWETFISKTNENQAQDMDGGWIFDIESLAFIVKPNNFNKILALVKIKSYNTFYKLWYLGICYDIPEYKFGIYLYIYLYKKLKSDAYNKALSEKGWSNAGKELEERDLAISKTNIIVYDRDNKLLAVPFYCGLPKYFAASFQLLSGQPPIVKRLMIEGVRHIGKYHIYQNIPNKFLVNTFINLLLKRDQLALINKKTIKL